MTFADRLAQAQTSTDSLVCVGLDPDPAKLPTDLGGSEELRSHRDLFADATPGSSAAQIATTAAASSAFLSLMARFPRCTVAEGE